MIEDRKTELRSSHCATGCVFLNSLLRGSMPVQVLIRIPLWMWWHQGEVSWSTYISTREKQSADMSWRTQVPQYTTVYHSIPQYTTVYHSIPQYQGLPAFQDLTVRLLDDVSVGIPFDAVLIARFRIQHDEFVSLPSKGANESLSAKEQQKNWQTLGHGWAWGQGVSTCWPVSNEAYSATWLGMIRRFMMMSYQIYQLSQAIARRNRPFSLVLDVSFACVPQHGPKFALDRSLGA